MKTQEELKQEFETLKVVYKPLYTIVAPLNDNETEFATVYLKKPDRIAQAAVGKLAGGTDPLKAVEFALKNLYVGGDNIDLILQNEEALFSCESPLVQLFERKQAALKKN